MQTYPNYVKLFWANNMKLPLEILTKISSEIFEWRYVLSNEKYSLGVNPSEQDSSLPWSFSFKKIWWIKRNYFHDMTEFMFIDFGLHLFFVLDFYLMTSTDDLSEIVLTRPGIFLSLRFFLGMWVCFNRRHCSKRSNANRQYRTRW
jgi:hypothetical protein